MIFAGGTTTCIVPIWVHHQFSLKCVSWPQSACSVLSASSRRRPFHLPDDAKPLRIPANFPVGRRRRGRRYGTRSFLLYPPTTQFLYFQEDRFGEVGQCFQAVRVRGHPPRCILTFGRRWTESIAQKMKRKKKTEDLNARKEIWRSVFEPYVPPGHGDLGYVSRHHTPETSDLTARPAQTKTLDHQPPMSQAEFDASVTSTLSLSHSLSFTAWYKVSGRLF